MLTNLRGLNFYHNGFVGTVPASLCGIENFNYDGLYLYESGLSCYADCLSSLMEMVHFNIDGNAQRCSYYQDSALCGFVAATNIDTVYEEWSCDANWKTTTDPCGDGEIGSWRGIECVDGLISSLVLSSVPIHGTLCISQANV